MESTAHRAIAIVGAGAVLPDAANVAAFWENVKSGRYSITEISPDRWDPALYYDADPAAPDKTYSKIGGWVREYVWDPMKWRMAIPPRVCDAMDQAQKWAIAATREALEDYGYPKRPLNPDRVAVILGNAMAGEKHYLTALRVFFPEYAHELAGTASFAALPEAVRARITQELHDRMGQHLPEITEDSMPGELANCIAGRIANIYNFHGPNFICDAACASAMAATNASIDPSARAICCPRAMTCDRTHEIAFLMPFTRRGTPRRKRWQTCPTFSHQGAGFHWMAPRGASRSLVRRGGRFSAELTDNF